MRTSLQFQITRQLATGQKQTFGRTRFLMPSEKRPHDLIRDLVTERASWFDADVIAEIEQLPVGG